MLSILSVSFPFFALIACGYGAARCGLLALAAIPALNSFVLFFALPCMLYRFGASAPVAELLAPGVVLTYLLGALLMVGVCLGLTRRGALGWNDAAFGALVAAFPNTGFMGVPLLVALWGPAAASPVIVSLLVDMVLTTSLCIALSRLGSHASPSGAPALRAGQAARKALRGVLANPLPWAILAGALVSWQALPVPRPLASTIGLLADAASPVALFTLGAVLARAPTAPAGAPALPWRSTLPLAALKLFVHPVLVWGLGLALQALGLPLDRFAFKVLVLAAALPSASNVVLLAERYGADSGRIARIIVQSTVCAFFSFCGAVALLGGA